MEQTLNNSTSDRLGAGTKREKRESVDSTVQADRRALETGRHVIPTSSVVVTAGGAVGAAFLGASLAGPVGLVGGAVIGAALGLLVQRSHKK